MQWLLSVRRGSALSFYTVQIKMLAYDLQHCASDSALADVCGKSTLVKFGSFPLV